MCDQISELISVHAFFYEICFVVIVFFLPFHILILLDEGHSDPAGLVVVNVGVLYRLPVFLLTTLVVVPLAGQLGCGMRRAGVGAYLLLLPPSFSFLLCLLFLSNDVILLSDSVVMIDFFATNCVDTAG